jgi:hypothetical protein
MSMNHPLALPSIAYLYFVKRQARILGRRAQRSGLHERARHYSFRWDWADGLMREISAEWAEAIKAAEERMRLQYPGWHTIIGP